MWEGRQIPGSGGKISPLRGGIPGSNSEGSLASKLFKDPALPSNFRAPCINAFEGTGLSRFVPGPPTKTPIEQFVAPPRYDVAWQHSPRPQSKPPLLHEDFFNYNNRRDSTLRLSPELDYDSEEEAKPEVLVVHGDSPKEPNVEAGEVEKETEIMRIQGGAWPDDQPQNTTSSTRISFDVVTEQSIDSIANKLFGEQNRVSTAMSEDASRAFSEITMPEFLEAEQVASHRDQLQPSSIGANEISNDHKDDMHKKLPGVKIFDPHKPNDINENAIPIDQKDDSVIDSMFDDLVRQRGNIKLESYYKSTIGRRIGISQLNS